MFWILIILAVCCIAGCVYFYFEKQVNKALICGIAAFVLFTSGWLTPQGQMYWAQLIATGMTGNWIVVDNSGSKTMRHWILKESYVGSSDQSDGWKFLSADGVAYVGGDAFVLRIEEPLEEFLKDYRVKYNIPENLTALE